MMLQARWLTIFNVTDDTLPGGILIIGIGNTLRRDDGAGWLFAEALAAHLRQAGLTVHLTLRHQLTPELALNAVELQPAAIIFVDASIAVTEPTLTMLNLAESACTASHGLTPIALLTLMRRLYAIAAPGWLLQTPAEDFGHGEGLSRTAQRGVDGTKAVAAALLEGYLPIT